MAAPSARIVKQVAKKVAEIGPETVINAAKQGFAVVVVANQLKQASDNITELMSKVSGSVAESTQAEGKNTFDDVALAKSEYVDKVAETKNTTVVVAEANPVDKVAETKNTTVVAEANPASQVSLAGKNIVAGKTNDPPSQGSVAGTSKMTEDNSLAAEHVKVKVADHAGKGNV